MEMTSQSKKHNRSYLKDHKEYSSSKLHKIGPYFDTQAFPDDFFCTLNLNNIRSGPRVSKMIYRQVKSHHNKSVSSVCRRDNRLDIDDSYFLPDSEASPKKQKLRLPDIRNLKNGNNSCIGNIKGHTNGLREKTSQEARRHLSQRKLTRYMRSEERFRHTKKLDFGNQSIFDIDPTPFKLQYNSPEPKREISKESTRATFKIRPFNLECSTATNTSHSTRRPDSVKKSPTEMVCRDELVSFRENDTRHLCSNSDTQKCIIPIKLSPPHIKIDAEKIKARYKKLSLDKIKLKFRRDKLRSLHYQNTRVNSLNNSESDLSISAKKYITSGVSRLHYPFHSTQRVDEELPRCTAYFGMQD